MTIVERLNAIAKKLGAEEEATTVQQGLSIIEGTLENKSAKTSAPKKTSQKTDKKGFTYSADSDAE